MTRKHRLAHRWLWPLLTLVLVLGLVQAIRLTTKPPPEKEAASPEETAPSAPEAQ